MITLSARRKSYTTAVATALLAALASSPATAQIITLAPGSATVPPASAGCAAFAPAGDLFDPYAGVGLPMGPAGCGLAWPFGAGNVNAFSSGVSAAFTGLAVPVPVPTPPGPGVSVVFSVDPFATSASVSGCAAMTPAPPSVLTEAAGLPSFSDAPTDLFISGGNMTASLPGIDFMSHTQAVDGDGVATPPGFIPPATFLPPFGLIEPMPGGDDVDGIDAAPLGAAVDFAPAGGDGIPDVPVYYSVDAATAAGSAGALSSSDILTTSAGAPPVPYVAAAALGLDGGGFATDDIDALGVYDVAGDGVYAPGAGDIVLYSLAPGSGSLGTVDPCLGLAIEAGDVLIDGVSAGFPGAACVYIPEENLLLYPLRGCGPNPVTGGGEDNIDGIELAPGGPTPGSTTTTTTTVTSTTTSTTSTTATSTTTTTLGSLCASTPLAGCRGGAAGKSQIQFRVKDDPAKNKFKLKYKKGEATTTGEFADPVGGSADYRLCLYDDSAATQPLMELAVAPGGTCGGKPCWKATGTKGFKYKNKGGAGSSGVEQVKLKSGDDGKSQIQVKGKGALLPVPALPLTVTVTGQFVIDDGGVLCWEVPVSVTIKNETGKFKGKGP